MSLSSEKPQLVARQGLGLILQRGSSTGSRHGCDGCGCVVLVPGPIQELLMYVTRQLRLAAYVSSSPTVYVVMNLTFSTLQLKVTKL